MTQLAGKIEDLGLGEILQIICFSRKSGVLRLETDVNSAEIHFHDGNIIKATATELTEGVGDVLLKNENITSIQLDKARAMQRENNYTTLLGDILIKEFRVAEETVQKIAVDLIKRVTYYLFQWTEGKFVFELTGKEKSPEQIKNDPLQFTLDEGLNPQMLALEGTKRLDESRKEGTAQTLGSINTSTGEPEVAAPAEPEDINEFQAMFDELEEGDGFLEDVEEEDSAPEDRGFRILKYMLSELSDSQSVNEIVLLILRFSSEIVNRAVVFGVKNKSIVGLGQSGIEITDDIPDKRIRAMNIPINEPSILRKAVENKGLIVVNKLEELPWNNYIKKELGGHEPEEAFAAPILVQGKVALLLYGDNAPINQRLGDVSILEIFIAQTNIALEKILLNKELHRR